MSNWRDLVPDLVRRAAERVLSGDCDGARSALSSIDYERLVSDRDLALRKRRARLARVEFWQQNPPYEPGPHRRVAQKHRRRNPPKAIRLATFERDHFVCRYSHCRKRTIHIPVLRMLSALFPDIIPYNSNWRPLEDCILYWTYSASLEHKTSLPHGGTSNPDNLITACYACNDIKNMIRAGDLGWELAEIREDDWDGLNSYLPALEKVVAGLSVKGSR